MRGLSNVPNRIKTTTIRGVKTCNARVGSIIRAIRACGRLSFRGHVFAGRRYLCDCQSDFFGGRRGSPRVIACMGVHLDGGPQFSIGCNGLGRRLTGCPGVALRTIQSTIVSVHHRGLPSSSRLKGTKDFFVGPIVPIIRCRGLGERCPSVPSCPTKRKGVGIPTN